MLINRIIKSDRDSKKPKDEHALPQGMKKAVGARIQNDDIKEIVSRLEYSLPEQDRDLVQKTFS